MTTVVIAHRLNTIRNADLIYVLDKGQVIEAGTHEELIRYNKTYAEYYKSQQSAMAILRNLKDNVEADHFDQESISEDKMTEEDNQIKELISKENLEAERELTLYEISSRLLTFTKPFFYIVVVFFGSIFVGVSMACAAIPSGKGIYKISGKDTKHEKWEAMWHSIIELSAQTVFVLVVHSFSKYFLRRITDKLSINLRSQTFRTLIKQPIQFFDSKTNSVGSLVGMLSAEIRHLNGASVEIYLLVLHGVSGLITAIVITLVYSWRIGLMVLPVLPLFSVGSAIQFNLQFTPPNKTKTSSKRQFNMVSDCIMHYQTIASLAYEDEYLCKYKIKPNDQARGGILDTADINIPNAFIIGFCYAISQTTLLVLYAVGSLSVAERLGSGESVTNSFTAVTTTYMGGFALCNALMNGPNFSKGKAVASMILKVIEKPKEGTETSPIVDGEESITKEIASQEIKFSNVWFKYPLENSRWVLKNFNLTIKPGQCVGLIGESGSGKSTIVQLLLRFYDPQEGNISIGGVNIKNFTISSLRSMLGLVQQEPTLFNTSVMENIIYGKPDANAEEIRKATNMANAHHFICNLDTNEQNEIDNNIEIREDQRYDSLEPGYKASCGSKGSKLSGGQKQRIAIARALVRDPPILLLDEATSALDEKSQQEVQQALDGIVGKKTCIVIAHRTSTLKNCHKVYEISEGTIMN